MLVAARRRHAGRARRRPRVRRPGRARSPASASASVLGHPLRLRPVGDGAAAARDLRPAASRCCPRLRPSIGVVVLAQIPSPRARRHRARHGRGRSPSSGRLAGLIGSTEPPLPVQLGAVPETLLWTLYYRAVEARRPDSVLDDPMAVELVERIDFPFEQRFGSRGRASRSGRRSVPAASTRDRALPRRLAAARSSRSARGSRRSSGASTTVPCGGSASTCPRRSSCAGFLLPSPRRMADRLLGARRSLARPRSIRAADVLVTAQGLLMYLEPEEVHTVLTDLRASASPARSCLRRRVALAQPTKRRGKVDAGAGIDRRRGRGGSTAAKSGGCVRSGAS